RGADLGDQCHGGAPGCRNSRLSAARFSDERRDIGMKSGDLTQQICRLDRMRTFPTEDGEREGTYPLMRCGELADQARIYVWGGEHVADQGERGNPHDRLYARTRGRPD